MTIYTVVTEDYTVKCFSSVRKVKHFIKMNYPDARYNEDMKTPLPLTKEMSHGRIVRLYEYEQKDWTLRIERHDI